MQYSEDSADSSRRNSPRESISEAFKSLLRRTAKRLKGSARRLFMAETVQQYGPGGQIWAEKELEWNRCTIRKGMHELRTGIECKDGFSLRGRKASRQRLPNLLEDIRGIIDPNAQTDATFRTGCLYVRITAKEVRELLIEERGYKDEELPKRRTISTLLNQLGYRLRKVKKTGR
jgi:hypothetical protein